MLVSFINKVCNFHWRNRQSTNNLKARNGKNITSLTLLFRLLKIGPCVKYCTDVLEPLSMSDLRVNVVVYEPYAKSTRI